MLTLLSGTDSPTDGQSSDSGSSTMEEASVSPRRNISTSSRNKENFISPYFSPSRLPPRSRSSPLQEVQNTVNRTLDFSPLKKVCLPLHRYYCCYLWLRINISHICLRIKIKLHSLILWNLQMVSPSKRQLTSPQKPSPPDDFDTTSQDSGYSESGKKVEEDW